MCERYTGDRSSPKFQDWSKIIQDEIDVTFSYRTRDVAMVTIFGEGGGLSEIAISHLYSSYWHSTTDWKIATPIGALTQAMNPLHIDCWAGWATRCRLCHAFSS